MKKALNLLLAIMLGPLVAGVYLIGFLTTVWIKLTERK